MNPRPAVAPLAALSFAAFSLVTASAFAEPEARGEVKVEVKEGKREPRREGREEVRVEGKGEAVEAEGRYPLAEAERPITLGRFMLSPEADFDITRTPGISLLRPGATLYANLSVLASFGVTDDFTVRALVLPLQLAGPSALGSGFHYGQASENLGPGVGATYRFLRGPLEVGAALDLNIISITGLSGVVIAPGIPIRYHASKSLRIDAVPTLPITFSSASDAVGGPSQTANRVGLSIPVSVLYDITEPLHIGAMTGFAIDDFSAAGDSARIPLGVFTGYAFGGKDGPVLDVDPFFTFPSFFTPGADSKTATGNYVIGVNVGGFLYL